MLQNSQCHYYYLPDNNMTHTSFQCHALAAVNVLGKKMIRQIWTIFSICGPCRHKVFPV